MERERQAISAEGRVRSMRTFTEEEVEEMMDKSTEHDGCKGCKYENYREHIRNLIRQLKEYL